MSFCPNCGSPIDVGARFCSNCGTALAVVPVTTATPVNYTATAASGNYRIIIVSRGTCARSVAIDLISDLLGYTDAEAARILDGAPMEAAVGLSAVQAQYLAQAFSEYGMDISVFDGNNYVDFSDRASSSVFDSAGNFLSGVVTALAGVGLANRVSSFTRWLRPAPPVFRPRYARPAPVTTYRRRRPAPKPVVRPVQPAPHPTPHAASPVRPVQPAPKPAPKPAPAVRPVTPPKPAPAARPVAPAPKPVTPVKPVAPAPGAGRAAPNPKGAGRPDGNKPGGRR